MIEASDGHRLGDLGTSWIQNQESERSRQKTHGTVLREIKWGDKQQKESGLPQNNRKKAGDQTGPPETLWLVLGSPLLRGCGLCELSDLKVDAELEEPDGEIRVVKWDVCSSTEMDREGQKAQGCKLEVNSSLHPTNWVFVLCQLVQDTEDQDRHGVYNLEEVRAINKWKK